MEQYKPLQDSSLEKKLDYSYNRVFKSLEKSRISIPRSQICITNQQDLQKMNFAEKENLEENLFETSYIRGVYSTINDVIFLDRLFSENENERAVDYVLSHEYLHKLLAEYNYALKENIQKRKRDPQLKWPEGSYDPVQEILNRLNKNCKNKMTEDEKRKFQFESYIEESFVIAGGLYLVNNVSDYTWTKLSRMRIGNTLEKDKEFIKKLEETLKASFFDSMFDMA
ncbi:MAG: hypothetical protein PVJ67_02655 [Candidatus Pacearchaeota archaeon]|jgi:hypothetical protein